MRNFSKIISFVISLAFLFLILYSSILILAFGDENNNIKEIFKIDKYEIIGNNNEIDEKKFYVAGFNDMSNKILAIAPIVDINLKKQDKNYRLYFISITENPKIEKIDIPLFNIQQYIFYNNKLYLIGNNLTTLAALDLNKNSFDILTQVEIGKPSFRYFGLIWLENNSLFVPGYKMDEKQFSEDTFIYKLNIENNKVNFINTNFNLTKIEKEQKPIELVILNSEKIALLKQEIDKKNNKISLITVDKNYKIKEIETGDTFGGLAFSNNYLLYSFKQKNRILYSLYDFNNEQTFIKNEFNVPLMYPFISKNSNIIIFSNYNPKTNKMDTYLGKKDNNYKLNKIIEKADLGYIKVSKDGEYFLIFNIKGYLTLFKVN